MPIWIDDEPLPPTSLALGPDSDAPGLLAAGGQLTPERLEQAYRQGVFPWFGPGQPVLWWSPDPRMVLPVADFKVSKSLAKTLRRFQRTPGCELRIDSAFAHVIEACAHTPREGQAGTWIVPTFNWELRTAKPVFLYWGAEWCPPCHDLKAHVFSRSDFQQKLRQFVPVYLDGVGTVQAYNSVIVRAQILMGALNRTASKRGKLIEPKLESEGPRDDAKHDLALVRLKFRSKYVGRFPQQLSKFRL